MMYSKYCTTTTMKVAGKTGIVFGGARGIGKACALMLLQNGANIAIADILEEEGLQTRDEFNTEFSGRVIFVKCDVTSETDIDKAFAMIQEVHGNIHICVNTAGIAMEKDWQKTMDVNFGGCVRITESAKKWMVYNTGAEMLDIIHVASILGLVRYPIFPAYVSSKHAIVGYVRSVAADKEVNGLKGFKINAICPGYCDTVLMMSNTSLIGDDLHGDTVSTLQKEGKIMSPVRVAEGMMKLIKDDSLNGECMVVLPDQGCFLDEAATDKFYSQML